MSQMIPNPNAYQIVRGNHIKITQSDGTGCGPTRAPARGSYKPADKVTLNRWFKKIGKHLALEYLQKDNSMTWYLDAFPPGYNLWVHDKPQTSKYFARKDAYLYGSKYIFRSPEEFYEHAAWLISGSPASSSGKTACPCKFCTHSKHVINPKRRRQPATALPAGGRADPMTVRTHIERYGLKALPQKAGGSSAPLH